MGTREHHPVSSSNRIREMKKKVDFSARMVENQGADRPNRINPVFVWKAIGASALAHIPSPTEYIRSTRTRENLSSDRPANGRQENSVIDVPTEAQVRAFENLNNK
jgi:hypothetical protein